MRFVPHYQRIRNATDPLLEIRSLPDEAVVEALAAASLELDPYVANVLATEAANRLRQSRTINAHLGEGVVSVDDHGRIVFMNPAAEARLAITHREARGRPLDDVVAVCDARARRLQRDAHPVHDVLRHGATVRRDDLVMQNRRGDRFPVTLTLSPTLVEGDVTGAVVLFRDTTEDQRTRDALALALEQRETIMEAIPDIIYLLDADARLVHWNPVAERATGLSPDALRGRDIFDFFDAADVPRVRDALERARTEGHAAVEAELVHRDGARTVYDWQCVPLHASDGRVVGFTGAGRDLTERKRYEDALRRRHAELKRLLETVGESMIEGLVVLSPDGHILHLNSASRDITGLDPEKFLGEHLYSAAWRALRPDGTPIPDEERPIRRMMRDQEAMHDLEFVLERADGVRVPVAGSAVPVKDEDGRILSIVGVFTDLTKTRSSEEEINRLNRELQQRVRELESAFEEVDAFSYSASHDLRAPLRAIGYFCDALVEDHGAELSPGAREYTTRIRREAERMTALVNDLLTLSRVSREDVVREPVDLAHIARNVTTRLRERDPERRVELSIVPQAPAEADPRLVRLVLENVLGNAWKYTAREPVARITFDVERSATGSPVYCVRDNGIGLDAAAAKEIFHPFKRLQRPADFPGTGIGLAIVERVVARHGGRVWAEGEPGVGATFRFTLGPA